MQVFKFIATNGIDDYKIYKVDFHRSREILERTKTLLRHSRHSLALPDQTDMSHDVKVERADGNITSEELISCLKISF